MTWLSQLVEHKKAWLLLFISALLLEATALYFQYMMDLQPCIMCIYQRVAVFALIFAGLIGSLNANFVLSRMIGFALWGTGAIWGFLIAKEHVTIQEESTLSFFYTCDVVPNFPAWAPLHEWLPALFKATGDCGKISWQFLGYSMPQWMEIIFAGYALIFIVVLLNRLICKKMF